MIASWHEVNAFQMCINLANEQMQSYANEYIFMKEQEDCLLEGVPLVELNYRNNQPIIDTFMEVGLVFWDHEILVINKQKGKNSPHKKTVIIFVTGNILMTCKWSYAEKCWNTGHYRWRKPVS